MRPLALLFALCASVALAAPPVVKLPESVSGDVGSFVTVRAECDAKVVVFHAIDSGLNVFPAGLLVDSKATVVTASQAGRYRILAYSGNEDGPSLPVVVTAVIGNAPPPVPPGPQPPGPTPKPDDPKPDPLPVQGLRVLMMYDKQGDSAAWGDVLFGKEVTAYLDAKCGKDGWRVWDDTPDVTNQSAEWKAIFSGAKQHWAGKPTLYVVKNGKGEFLALPDTVPAALEILKRYGG